MNWWRRKPRTIEVPERYLVIAAMNRIDAHIQDLTEAIREHTNNQMPIRVRPLETPIMVDLPLDLKLAARDLRQTNIDIRATCEIIARALEPHIPDHMLPPDRLQARRNSE